MEPFLSAIRRSVDIGPSTETAKKYSWEERGYMRRRRRPGGLSSRRTIDAWLPRRVVRRRRMYRQRRRSHYLSETPARSRAQNVVLKSLEYLLTLGLRRAVTMRRQQLPAQGPRPGINQEDPPPASPTAVLAHGADDA